MAPDQNYLDIDVTGLVQTMLDDPQNSDGFSLQLVTEEPYRQVLFAATPPTEAEADAPAPPTSPSPSSVPPPNVVSPATDASKSAFEAPATPAAPVSTPPRPAGVNASEQQR